ncbi:RNA recognition motif domain-containing protein [Ditylenchus destructor]|uniref:RNA recognition motif domain-containing protein n=1 Tax=Ditylenchus destructor TaxID=166010 RepID=A0AAD4NFC0_9BILA|nr:RNA recognition motif domain-containing protein [Ditylenchus destructor]
MSDILDIAEGEEEFNPEDLDEKEVLGDDDEAGHNKIKKEDADGDDLYDAAIEPSGMVNENVKRESVEAPPTPTKLSIQHISITQNSGGSSGRRYCCYVGNMTWWTTDSDLQSLLQGFGVTDIVDIKFHENRNNGQSKGFALLVVANESSVKIVMEKLPSVKLHEQSLIVLPYNKMSLAKLEDATKRVDQKEKKDEKTGMVNIGTVRIAPQSTAPAPTPIQSINLGLQLSNLTRPNLPQIHSTGQPPTSIQPLMHHQQPQHRPPVNLAAPPPNMQPQMNAMNRPPPGFPPQNSLNISGPPPNVPMQTIRTSLPPPGIPGMQPQSQSNFPPGAHINPNVYPGFAPSFGGHVDNGGAISEAEFEEIMNRNRTVSSSAISRAWSDAAAGDYASAIETLATAISLIRQSRVANDDRCKVLISTLQDTLQSVESKSYNSSRKHRSGRDRSRSPDRGMRKHRRRSSRSRSRSRDRYDYSPRHGRRY